jgi:hypothetical protein
VTDRAHAVTGQGARAPGASDGAVAPAWAAAIELFVEHLEGERGRRPHTVAAYRRDVTDLARACGEQDVDHPADVDLLVLRRYLADLVERGYARSTVARRASSLRSFFALLRRREVVERDPAALLGSPKQGRHLPRVLRVDEVDRLVAAPDATTPGRIFATACCSSCSTRAARACRRPAGSTSARWTATRACSGSTARAARNGSSRSGRRRCDSLDRLPRVARPELVGDRTTDALLLSNPRRSARGARRADGRRTAPRGGPGSGTSPRTRSATRSRPTCWRAAPTSAWSRSCSDTRRSPRRSATPTCPAAGSARCTRRPTHVPEPARHGTVG